jgi:hypothetical protein
VLKGNSRQHVHFYCCCCCCCRTTGQAPSQFPLPTAFSGPPPKLQHTPSQQSACLALHLLQQSKWQGVPASYATWNAGVCSSCIPWVVEKSETGRAILLAMDRSGRCVCIIGRPAVLRMAVHAVLRLRCCQAFQTRTS